MRWDLGVGDSGALKFVQGRLRDALEVARTTKYKEAIYFTELTYLAVSELIREDLARRTPQDNRQERLRHAFRRPSKSYRDTLPS